MSGSAASCRATGTPALRAPHQAEVHAVVHAAALGLGGRHGGAWDGRGRGAGEPPERTADQGSPPPLHQGSSEPLASEDSGIVVVLAREAGRRWRVPGDFEYALRLRSTSESPALSSDQGSLAVSGSTSAHGSPWARGPSSAVPRSAPGEEPLRHGGAARSGDRATRPAFGAGGSMPRLDAAALAGRFSEILRGGGDAASFSGGGGTFAANSRLSGPGNCLSRLLCPGDRPQKPTSWIRASKCEGKYWAEMW